MIVIVAKQLQAHIRSMRRFTSLAHGCWKQLETQEHSVELYFMNSKSRRIHSALRVIPAMAAGFVDRVWSQEEVVALTDKAANRVNPVEHWKIWKRHHQQSNCIDIVHDTP